MDGENILITQSNSLVLNGLNVLAQKRDVCELNDTNVNIIDRLFCELGNFSTLSGMHCFHYSFSGSAILIAFNMLGDVYLYFSIEILNLHAYLYAKYRDTRSFCHLSFRTRNELCLQLLRSSQ